MVTRQEPVGEALGPPGGGRGAGARHTDTRPTRMAITQRKGGGGTCQARNDTAKGE
jgi:hypothetical protein